VAGACHQSLTEFLVYVEVQKTAVMENSARLKKDVNVSVNLLCSFRKLLRNKPGAWAECPVKVV
jgi:hypothetical protein